MVVGTGGLAREFTAWFENLNQISGYCSTNAMQHSEYNLPGQHYDLDVTPELAGTKLAAIAIADPNIKYKMFEILTQQGFEFPNFIHPSSVVANSLSSAAGVIIAPNCTVAPNTKFGTCTYLNFNCGVGHETIIGAFTQINPGAQIGGAANIGDKVLIGSGATVLQGITVENNATVGSGATVFSKVIAHSVVLGNPARRMQALEKANN